MLSCIVLYCTVLKLECTNMYITGVLYETFLLVSFHVDCNPFIKVA